MSNFPHNLRSAQATLAALHSRGESPKSLGYKKRKRVCNFVDEFRFAPGRHIDMVGCEPGFLQRGTRIKYGLADQLQEEGLLRGFNGGGRFGKLYTLTPRGQDLCDRFSPFKGFDPAKIGEKMVDHILAAQRFTLKALGHNFMTHFEGERGHGGDRRGSKRPDIIFHRSGGERWGVEIERNPKKGRELDQFIEACIDHKRYDYDGIIVSFEAEALLASYTKKFKACETSVRSWSQDSYDDWICERCDVNSSVWSGIIFGMVDDWEMFTRPVVPRGCEDVPMPEGLKMGRC